MISNIIMGTKEEIFNKIGDLLQDLNAQYLSLSEQHNLSEVNELVTLEAKAQSLAAYATLLKTSVILQDEKSALGLRPTAMESKKIAFNDYFTPPSAIRSSSQPQNIQEEVQSDVFLKQEELVQDEEVRSEITVDKEPTQARSFVAEDVADEEDKSINELRADSENESPALDKTEEPIVDETDHVRAVVTEVVEEPKEVVIEEPERNVIQEEVNTVVEETPSRPLTLNEIISQQKQAGVQNRVYQVNQPGSAEKLTDIKTGISLNDKLLFIKDLFNGYSLAYSEAVELLNRFSSYAEADAFLQTNYAVKNKWADKPHTVEKLYEVLRRRYN